MGVKDSTNFIWIARDGNGSLYMYFQEPVRNNITLPHWKGGTYVCLDDTPLDDYFVSLSFDDGPVKITLSKQ